MTTFEQQSKAYLQQVAERRKNPAKPGTLATYNSCLINWIIPKIGQLPLGKVENGAMKGLVDHLAKAKLAPSTISVMQNIVKEVVSSATDKRGNELYPRVWNSKFIDAPSIDSTHQKSPSISSLEADTAILNAPSVYRSLFLLAAGSGLRISEILALKARPDSKSSYFDPTRQTLVVNSALYRGREQATKTAAGVREVDLFPALSEYLAKHCPSSGRLIPVGRQSAYNVAENYHIPGFHSFRRFRATFLENNNVPNGLIKFWMGHAGKDVTDRYIKVGADIETRKQWAGKIGIGVSIP